MEDQVGSLPPEETIQAKWEMRAGIAAVVAGAVIGLIELIRRLTHPCIRVRSSTVANRGEPDPASRHRTPDCRPCGSAIGPAVRPVDGKRLTSL